MKLKQVIINNQKIFTLIQITACCLLMSCTTHNDGNSDGDKVDSAAKQKISEIAERQSKFIRKRPVYDSGKKYIYLTFDDGPQGAGTHNCLEICKALNIKATFFMVGVHAEGEGGLKKNGIVNVIRESYPQFLLANHSTNHAKNKYKHFYSKENVEYAFNDFIETQKKLNIPFKIIRLPGRNSWVQKGHVGPFDNKDAKNVCIKLDSAGYDVLGWDAEWGSYTRGSSHKIQGFQEMVQVVENALKNGTHEPNHVVILTHDRLYHKEEEKNILMEVLQELKKNPDYIFETIDNYPKLKM